MLNKPDVILQLTRGGCISDTSCDIYMAGLMAQKYVLIHIIA
ncbi:hypothetical protein [Thioflexithrix psekupsensis]|nr:hypothetical protein [Thioflexithrix psekupsensis]